MHDIPPLEVFELFDLESVDVSLVDCIIIIIILFALGYFVLTSYLPHCTTSRDLKI